MIKKADRKFSGLFMVLILIVIYIFFFLKRFIYPDTSFDTINYHFFLGKNGFENFPFPFNKEEFFPLGMHGFNPIIDMFGYAFYVLFGFRLGTILSLLSLIGIVIIGYLFLKKFFKEVFQIRSALIIIPVLGIPVFIVHEALFQVATYFTDNVYACFLMAYLFFSFLFLDAEKKIEFPVTFLLGVLGGIIMTKLTNYIYIIPFFLIYGYFMYRKYRYEKYRYIRVLSLTTVFGFTVLCFNYFMIFNFVNSGNPIFPYFNAIFKSSYYPKTSWHFNFGPTTLLEQVFYPFYAMATPTLLGEVKDAFPDRKLLVLFFYVSIMLAYFLVKKEKFNVYEGTLLFTFFLSFFLWQFQFGYSRYGIFLEIMGGMIALILTTKTLFKPERSYFPKILTVIFSAYMVIQAEQILCFNYKYDFSWRPTPTLAQWWQGINADELFKKYTLLNKSVSQEVRNADIIIQCANPSSLYFSTISELEDLPMINLDKGSNHDLSENDAYRKERDKRIFESIAQKKGQEQDELNFAIVVNEKGGPDSGISEKRCFEAIAKENERGKRIVVTKEFETDNYVGDKGFILKILIGKYFHKN